MRCAPPRVVLRLMFTLPPRARLPKPRPMRRATLPVSPLSSRPSPRASLPKATLTASVTSRIVLPLVSRLSPLARPQRPLTMRLATRPTVLLHRAPSLPVSLPRSQLTELATSPSALLTAPQLDLLRLSRTLRFPLTPLVTSSPLVPPPGYLPSPLVNRRRSRSTRRVACLPRLLAPL